MRKFEKISKDNFFNSVPNGNYEDIILPKRSTKNSAGYDFYSLYDITIKPNERVVIPTGIKVCMNENEFLGIYIRSSLGFKYNIRMCNQVGIIDADYINNKDKDILDLVELSHDECLELFNEYKEKNKEIY